MKQFSILLCGALILGATSFAQPPIEPPIIAPEAPPVVAPPMAREVSRATVKLLNNPAGKTDLKTPENTVRLFITALNEGNVATARTCVVSAQSMKKLARHDYIFQQISNMNLAISDLHTYLNGNFALVTLRATFVGLPDNQMPQFAIPWASSERLFLAYNENGWQILPDMATIKAYEPVDPLRMLDRLIGFATLLATPDVGGIIVDREGKERCQRNLKQLSLAVLQYVQIWDGKFPDSDKWHEQIMPYVKSTELFLCPQRETPNVVSSYAFNKQLSNVLLDKTANLDTIVTIYDAKNGELDFRHKLPDGEAAANVAFADGSIRLVSREEAKKLRWKP